ncbi:DUF3617 family protein [Tsuneonella sp. HG222]
MRQLIVLAAAAGLSGCGSGPDDAQVLAEAGRLAEPLPGLYRSTTTLESYEMPGAAMDQAQIARRRMEIEPQVREYCLTPEEAAGGFRRMLADMQDGDCAIERFETLDGRLSAAMRCAGENAIVSHIAMSGEADPERSNMTLAIEQQGDALPGGSVRMRMNVRNERTGDCPPAR